MSFDESSSDIAMIDSPNPAKSKQRGERKSERVVKNSRLHQLQNSLKPQKTVTVTGSQSEKKEGKGKHAAKTKHLVLIRLRKRLYNTWLNLLTKPLN